MKKAPFGVPLFSFKHFFADSMILEIKLAVVLPYFSYDLAGISDCDHICGNIACYNATRADNRIITDSDTRQNDHSRTQPTVSADVYRSVELICLLSKLAQRDKNRKTSLGADRLVRKRTAVFHPTACLYRKEHLAIGRVRPMPALIL